MQPGGPRCILGSVGAPLDARELAGYKRAGLLEPNPAQAEIAGSRAQKVRSRTEVARSKMIVISVKNSHGAGNRINDNVKYRNCRSRTVAMDCGLRGCRARGQRQWTRGSSIGRVYASRTESRTDVVGVRWQDEEYLQNTARSQTFS